MSAAAADVSKVYGGKIALIEPCKGDMDIGSGSSINSTFWVNIVVARLILP